MRPLPSICSRPGGVEKIFSGGHKELDVFALDGARGLVR